MSEKKLSRRDFLKLAGIATVTGLTPYHKISEIESKSLIKDRFNEKLRLDLPTRENLALTSLNTSEIPNQALITSKEFSDPDQGFIGNVYLETVNLDSGVYVSKPIDRFLGEGQVEISSIYRPREEKDNQISVICSVNESGFVRPDDGRGLYFSFFSQGDNVWNRTITQSVAPNVFKDVDNAELIDEAPIVACNIEDQKILLLYKKVIIAEGLMHSQIEAKVIDYTDPANIILSNTAVVIKQAKGGYSFQEQSFSLIKTSPNSFNLIFLSPELAAVSSNLTVNEKGVFVSAKMNEEIANTQTGNSTVRAATIIFDSSTNELTIQRNPEEDGLGCNDAYSCITSEGMVIKISSTQISKSHSLKPDSSWTKMVDLADYGFNFLVRPISAEIGGKKYIIVFAIEANTNLTALIAIDLDKPSDVYSIAAGPSTNFLAQSHSGSHLTSVHNINFNHLQAWDHQTLYKTFIPRIAKAK